jgi:hypothetical protein
MKMSVFLLVLVLSLSAQDSPFSQKPKPKSDPKKEPPKKKTDYSNVVWFTWEWTIVDDLSAEEFEGKKKIVETWQDNLWSAGEGNFALREVTIIDKSSKIGTMHTPAGLKDAGMLTKTVWAKCVFGGKPHMELPGNCDPFTWLHELGHLLFGCPEEYDSPNGCPCVEATGKKGGKMQWCDASNHSKEQAAQHPPCWEGYILKKYPNAKHPGPGGDRPDVKINVRNN